MTTTTRLRELLEQGLSLLQQGRSADAFAVLAEALKLAPAAFDALNLAGVAATRMGQGREAVSLLERATAQRRDHPGAHNNLGIALRAAGEIERAAEAYRRAIAIEPRYAAARTNLGTLLLDQRRYEQAVEALDQSLAYRPNHLETLTLKAAALRHLLMYEAALEAIDAALAIAPDSVDLNMTRAGLLVGLDRHQEALAAYRRAGELAPEHPAIPGLLVSTQLRLCDWSDLASQRARLLDAARSGQAPVSPFSSLLLFDDPEVQLALARTWQQRHAPDTRLAPVPAPGDKLRIGYFSADLRGHPMVHLIREMLATHDRDRFEITAFAFPAGGTDEHTEQVRQAVDRYVDISAISDSDAATLARELSIDIAIDLMGHTRGARPGLFARRVAPIQVNYLGHPGTTGAEWTDYIIADRMIIPEQSTRYFAEQVVWMPGCYITRDTQIEVQAPGLATRRSQDCRLMPSSIAASINPRRSCLSSSPTG